MRIILLILALAVMGPGDGKKKGRRANALYEKEEFSQAATLYRQGVLDVQEKGPGIVHSGLLNNLGASLFKQGEYEQAASAFASSSRMADNQESAVRANYNAGNAAAMQQEFETALEFYKSTLLSDPDNEDAKFNYEYVKRQLEEQQQREQDQNSDQQDDQQDNQDQNQRQDDQQDNQDQDQQQNLDQDQQQDPQQDPSDLREQQNPNELSKEEAQRILQALENEEEQLLRQIQKMKTRPRRVEKDW
ncbi:MAG: hypothetical protein BMS9Abin05_0183 [Rhodothermia bacterium]|nr:MAG: hypothetical protein BMS9Abin05_0183 [Rhodothermia bacterium]